MADHESNAPSPPASRFSARAFFLRDWPYLAMLVLALFGVAYTSVTRQAITTYWLILIPFFGVICVVARWRDVEGREPHWRLIQTQALHWVAVILATYLVFVADVKQMMNADARALMVLTLLALGTFTAGVHVGAWRICLVGVVLALWVPVIAWLETATLLLVLAAIVLGAFAVLHFLRDKERTAAGIAVGKSRMPPPS
ncbi:MAG: hypothetical protein HYS06_05960 [Methylocystis sp.]|nr:hypothetical protein [Methylocystis sp.]